MSNNIKTLMEGFRRYLMEEGPRHDVPDRLYYGCAAENLDSIRDNGIINQPSPLDFEENHIGVPFSSDIETARKYGDVVLEFDGQGLVNSGQYSVRPKETGIKVVMNDSAVDSGHGAHDMVDSLGTKVPFDFVTRMVFDGGTLPNAKKLRQNGFHGVEIATFGQEGEEPKVMHTPKPPEEA
tara:strand:- start:15 stop:557 length:543 start_codon:yes stop_codon:yes gene_type:complete